MVKLLSVPGRRVSDLAMALAMALRCLLPLLLLLSPLVTEVEGAKEKLRTNTPLESFLIIVQSTALSLHRASNNRTFDPKFYVDLPLRYNLPLTRGAFSRNSNGDQDDFNQFVAKYFFDPGSDLMNYSLPDFQQEPAGFLPKVADPVARSFALKIHSRWEKLARLVNNNVSKQPMQHTLLPLPHPVVVPGARFREVYYWDTYWIVRGLLVSKLYNTATAVVENLIYLVNTYGFIPNGARSYYLNRSQPPLLSATVKAVYLETGNLSLVEHAFPALMKEHAFWSTDDHRVRIRDAHGNRHVLTRYNAMWNLPRPESSTIDNTTAQGISDPEQRAELFHQIATTAESGWDFSSRWFANRQNLTTLKTYYILPVDLNSFLLQMENNIAYFAKLLRRKKAEVRFYRHAELRRAAINSIMWNEEKGQYLDYWLVKRNSTVGVEKNIHSFDKENQNTDVFPSNFFTLVTGVVLPGDEKVEKLVSSFKKSGLLLAGGVTTSLKQTGEQWDYPNAWPPLVHLLVEGFAESKSSEGLALAQDISKRWLDSNYVAFVKDGEMLEKYDARYCGVSGYGGEYQPQAGFGWSNGVVLSFLDRFGWATGTELACQP